jgi:hypothetical protein
MENIIVYSIWHFSSSDIFCVFSVMYRAMDERQRHRWKGHRWRDYRWRVTDEDGMKDTDKNHDFNIFDTDN